jgi:hypothetical protein
VNGSALRDTFGVEAEMDLVDARRIRDDLRKIWIAQVPGSADPAPNLDQALETDLQALKRWFDPIASGKRLRQQLSSGAETDESPWIPEPSLLIVDPRHHLVTPEGRVLLWMLDRAISDAGGGSSVYISNDVSQTGLGILAQTYKAWNRQRVDGVLALMGGRASTLRPTAAGLLLVLLINRNTAPERALPGAGSAKDLSEMSQAIATPAIAFARQLNATDRASERGLDLYRGWAMGEIARRLGSGLHQGSRGIWIDPESESVAKQRLIESLADRSAPFRERLPAAVDAALVEYNRVRPALSGLGLAFERPSNTRRLVEQILEVAAADGGESTS